MEWPYVGHWLSVEIGIVYTAVAGLLNVLIIIDAMVRADARDESDEITSRRSTFSHQEATSS